ncbi:MAG: thioredoxin family protein [Muribaculaceae bacterium]|nr:thioredoxin family protein [Muribaculaceae bacterium]
MTAKRTITFIAAALITLAAAAQERAKVYDESINPDAQITQAVAKASGEGKFVIAQLGGNWCKWCIRLARFIEGDPELKQLVDENFEYIHVNYNPREPQGDAEATAAALKRLGNPVRFGFPVLVVLDGEGKILHTQDSALLESGEGYDREKLLRFFSNWSPSALK